jgi:hypothetical protein
MCPSTFGELLELITPLVQGEGTNVRETISLKNMSIHVSNRCTTPLLHNEIQTCLQIFKRLHSQTTPHTISLRDTLCCANCLTVYGPLNYVLKVIAFINK